MRFVVYLLLFVAVFVIIERLFGVIVRGDLFKPGSLKTSFRELGKDLWLGARLFLVIWFIYLLINWWVRTR
jgi:hypothetical protein